MHFNVREDVIQLTEKWTGERLPDGRPYVPDEDLEELRKLTLEEIWMPLSFAGFGGWLGTGKGTGKPYTFEGNLLRVHNDNRKLVGRAVTCSYVPSRPDLEEVCRKIGDSEGRKGLANQWVIDTLIEGDVVVADMFDKVYEGTFVGGNLSTAIRNRTKTGGAVVWGGIRDIEQIEEIDGIQIYYRGADPTPITNFCMTGFNSVTKIGGAVCLPGDVVYGSREGIIFIPSYLVKTVIEFAKKSHVKDIFGFEMIRRNVYTTADVDVDVWTTDMMNNLVKFIQEDERGADYRTLDWTKEFEEAKKMGV